jgi:membrane protease YdiL (CAAX protease family)
VFYGTFYLSFHDTMQHTGFYLFYYSLLIFGFGLGGVYGVLYWRTRSIWPGFCAHALILILAALLAP